MVQRSDTIFQDQISEGFGGSAYHHFSLSLVDSRAAIDTNWEVTHIVPRAVRIINNRLVSTILMGNAQVNALTVWRNISGGTDRAVITSFDPDVSVLTADTVYTPTLSTTSADGYPHVVADQYDFYTMRLVANAATTGPFNLSYMAHVSFEDL